MLLDGHKYGDVYLATYLEKKGISRDLQSYYCRSGWLEPLGRGAFKRPNDTVNWQNGLQALVEQAELKLHIGGITALSQQGAGHYVRLGKEKVTLFSLSGFRLPVWFKNYDWDVEIVHITTRFLLTDEALGTVNGSASKLRSEPERAVLECLHLVPKKQDLVECYHLLEGLVNLRPKLVQKLLEECTSIKVKRLFLYLAEKANHQWLQYVDLSKVTLGKGDRSLADRGGVYVGKYKIIVPAELEAL